MKFEIGDFPEETLEEVLDYLSCPECQNSLMQRAYQKMEEFQETCNEENCDPEVLEDLEFFSWYKIYSEWDEEELKKEIQEYLK